MRWPLTFVTDFGVPEWSAACARGPVILIRPKYENDEGLYRHELVHVKQWLRTFSLHSILYLLSDDYKLKSEIEAYREQLQYSPGNEDLFAHFISTKYGLNITQAEAKELLV